MSETDSDRCETMESNMTTMASASSMAANVKALQRKRAALTKHYNYFNDIENVDRDREALLIREERLRATFEKFDEINLEICATDPKAGDSGDVESKFLEVITLIKKLMVNSATRPSAQPPSRHKLPQISVPTFTGKYSDFKPFINLFDALIDKDNSLEGVQKLFYLRSFLQGEPLDLVKNLPLVSDSYIQAKNILNDTVQ